jgi:hypothetical protein
MPDPCIVTLADPVLAAFTRRNKLAASWPVEKPDDKLPIFTPDDIDARALPVTLDPC